MFNFRVFCIFFMLTTLCTILFGQRPSNSQNMGKLPEFSVFEKRISMSGFSSGGSFAQMFQISHSSLIHGIGVFAHTYYRCGPPTGKVDDYDRQCTKLFNYTESQLYKPERVHNDIRSYQSQRLIDPIDNLRNKRLYVYVALRNFLFSADQSLAVLKVYERYINNPARIMTRVQDVELVLPTKNPYGLPCTEPADNRSFIGNCGLSGAFDALNFIHEADHTLQETSGTPKRTLMERLRPFDQKEFLNGLSKPHMDTTGYYFVPRSCEKRKCILHFYFHGCLTGREFEGTKHIENSGYLEVADGSDIIVIFPQALKSNPENEIGCWDTFGISGPLYATKRGDQIVAVKRMLDRATGRPDSSWSPVASSGSSNSGWGSYGSYGGGGGSGSSSSYGSYGQGGRTQSSGSGNEHRHKYRPGYGRHG